MPVHIRHRGGGLIGLRPPPHRLVHEARESGNCKRHRQHRVPQGPKVKAPAATAPPAAAAATVTTPAAATIATTPTPTATARTTRTVRSTAPPADVCTHRPAAPTKHRPARTAAAATTAGRPHVVQGGPPLPGERERRK